LRKLVIGMLRMANTILPFSDFARREVLRYAQPRRMVVAYPAVDVARFQPPASAKDNGLVLTTSYAIGAAYIRQKGLDTFVQAAAYVADARFVLTGQFVDEEAAALQASAPPNVEFTRRYLSDEELRDYFQRAKVYVQASAHEGFGLALAEAMAAGCVPVAVNATAMPEVVGDTGFYAPVGDEAAFGAAIRQALQDDGSRARAARERIANNFTLAHREQVLIGEVSRLLQRRGPVAFAPGESKNARPR
jgi:glycosyltransferase involved in cell wall biosynthesis